ncbi:MAG: hypothetical protein Q9212_002648 [Teloschistes hypoglaucus]
MTSSELNDWLKEEQSEGSGWSKGDGSGETVGIRIVLPFNLPLGVLVRESSSTVAFVSIEAFSDHHPSGRKIIQILDKNPNKDPDKYDEEDLQHMRKVVSYCKRHLAQEEKAKQDTDSKSYKSLKNWGHDALKT